MSRPARRPRHASQSAEFRLLTTTPAYCLIRKTKTYQDLATFEKLLVLTVMCHCTQLLQLLLLPDSLMR